MSIGREDINPVIRLCKEVFEENPHLDHYMNSISIGERTIDGRYKNVYRAKINIPSNLELTPGSESITGRSDGTEWSSIHFEKMDHKSLVNTISPEATRRQEDSYDRYSHRTHTEKKDLTSFRLYTPYSLLHESGAMHSMGVRVMKDIRTRGALINFNQIKEQLQLHQNTISKRVTEFYYVGKRNIFLGAAITDGYLIIRLQTIKNILRYNSRETAKEALKAILTAFDKLNEVFTKVNIRDCEDKLHPIITNKIYSLAATDRYFFPTSRMHLEEVEYFRKNIKKLVTKFMTTFTKNTAFGIDGRYSYSTIIENILTERREREQNLVQNSFMEGMQFGLKIEMVGWHPIKNPDFAANLRRDDVTSIWWTKDVSVIPDTFVYQSKHYRIPEDKRKWHITKLFVNQHGNMYCKDASGCPEHPNVSSGKVCTGNLIIDFKDKDTLLSETLINAERLLDVINYDSPHHRQDRDPLMEVSEELYVLDENHRDDFETEHVQSIRELDLDSCEEIDLSEGGTSIPDGIDAEIVLDDEGTEIGIAIAEDESVDIEEVEDRHIIYRDDVPTEADTYYYDGNGNDNGNDTSNVNVNDPITTEAAAAWSYSTNAEVVLDDGTTRPRVIIQPLPGELPEVIHVPEGMLSLGDNNIIS